MHSLITNPADLYEQLGEGQLANPGGISLQLTLTGPKLEIFGFGIFHKSDLKSKIKMVMFEAFYFPLYLCIFLHCRRHRFKKILLAEFFIFTLVFPLLATALRFFTALADRAKN
jgi:hypothetical protein